MTTPYRSGDLFDEWRVPQWLKPAVVGMLVGVVGLQAAQALGTGFPGTEVALNNELAMLTMAGLLLAKLLATDFTLGSSNSGGVFAPALFMDAMLGGIHLERGRDVDLMQGVTVAEVMTTDADVVPLSMSLDKLAAEFAATHHRGFPVVGEAGELAAVVSIQDLERAIAA